MGIKSLLEEETALILQAYGLPFIREYYFARPRKWRFDFAIPDEKIALECEGLVFNESMRKGRHQTPIGVAGDCEKYNTAAASGWRLFRCTNLGRGASTPSAVAKLIVDFRAQQK